MKKHVIVSLLMMILTLAPVLNVHAQADTDSQVENDGKKGKKEKMKKEKVKKPSKDELNAMVSQLNSQIKNLQTENERLKTAVAQKEDEVNQLQDELTAEKLKPAPAPVVVDPVNVKPEGIAFKVQVGAYQKFNINQYFTETKKISFEDVNGTNKYVIGYFTTLEAAKGFESDMKKMGIKDSWLVPYKDGVRITDEEAESILGQPIRDLKKKK
jgi:arsenate reductase-like glutaredoxin family protein